LSCNNKFINVVQNFFTKLPTQIAKILTKSQTALVLVTAFFTRAFNQNPIFKLLPNNKYILEEHD